MSRTLSYKVVGSDNNPDGSITLHIGVGYVEASVFTQTSEMAYTVPAGPAQTILNVEVSPGVTRRADMKTAFSDYLIAQGVTDGPLI